MKTLATLSLLAACVLAGCSDDDGGTSAGPGPGGEAELRAGVASAGGGPATGSGAGGAAGSVHVVSGGSIALGSPGPAPDPASAPAAPAGGTPVGQADLATDVVGAGNLEVSGDVESSGGGVRRIVSTGGSIVVSGTLSAAPGQGLSLEAPNGQIHVTGTLKSDGAAGADAGPISLAALVIVVRGRIGADGGPGGAQGGRGGDVSLTAHQAHYVLGELSTRGGTAEAHDGAVAGDAGNLTFSGGTVLDATGALRCRGGSARAVAAGARGGAGGTVRIDGFLAARLFGTLDLRGGAAAAAQSGAQGGPGGSLLGGDPNPLKSFERGGDLALDGGSGVAAGGAGGEMRLLTWGGPITLAGTTSLDGGAGALPGGGGRPTAICDPGAGRLTVRGTLRARGGAGSGPNAPGGYGGEGELRAMGGAGPLVFEAASTIDLGGGSATGTAEAGGGGELLVFASDATASIAGELLSRGGDAPGGTGGYGGFVWFRTDENANGIGGHITVETTGLIDVSGGAGVVGGSARNDGTDGIARFPNHNDMLAVILDADSAPGHLTDGIINNMGLIVARGGSAGGNGGDTVFHGQGVTTHDPEGGPQDRSGHGSGLPGQYFSQ